MTFAFEAMNAEGRVVNDVVDAATSNEAADALRSRGYIVMRVSQPRPGAEAVQTGSWLSSRRVNGRDLMVFTRQMKMLLDAGSALVPALEAVKMQCQKRSMRRLVQELCEHVERGGALSEAMTQHADIFPPIFRSMVAAGEATGTLGPTFARLSDIAHRQHQVRKTVIGALLYPAILSFMCVGVIGVLIGFVVPRFHDLFINLRAPLPWSTKFMFQLSNWITTYWPYVLGGVVAVAVAAWVTLRRASLRRRIDTWTLRLPFIGRVAARLLVARVLRVWAAMLRSHVPLLETIRQSQTAITSPILLDALRAVEDAVAGGGRVGRTLASTRLVEPVVASAISTGEENGRLAESVDFVATWLDDDNAQLIAVGTRIIEPTLLAVMGLVVGAVAMSLFLPLFDLATAGGG